MKFILLACLGMTLTANAGAEPSSQVAWTPQNLDFVKKGHADHGQELMGTCAGCHNETNANPNLEGQLPTYLYKQLQDYKSGSRKDPTTAMNGMASTLSDQDMADVAAWYGRQKPMRGKGGEEDLTGIVYRGDGKRMEPACSSCHGNSGQGEKVDTPRLAGQKAAYLENTLLAYKNGSRANDIYRRMRLIAAKLSAEEIKQLAEFYAKQD
ncbi:MAG: c-type cytochrome [Methylococcaceae bacterium]|nr:c-type cytochrome [Methylococcaceae bacterium]